MRTLVIAVLVTFFDFAQASETRVRPYSLEASSNAIDASGRWVTDQTLDVPLLAGTNSAKIKCYKESMSCVEAIAVLVTSKDDPYMPGQALFSFLNEYVIESWTLSKIRAKSEKRVAVVVLEFDLTRKSVSRRHQENESRGAAADSNFVVEW